MKLRLMDIPAEIESFAVVLRCAFDVVEESDAYANRGTSRLVRKYMDVRLRPSVGTESNGLTACRCAVRAAIENEETALLSDLGGEA